MAKFKVGDEMWIRTKICITGVQEAKSGQIIYSTDKEIHIREAILNQIRSVSIAPVMFQSKPDGVCKYGYHAPDGRCMSSAGLISPMPTFQCIREKCKAHRDYKEPQPAHRFKVGDRVVINESGDLGEVSAIHGDSIPYLVFHKKGMHSGDGFGVKVAKPEHENKCGWFCGWMLSPAPAPEPPKFYTGKVFAEKSDNKLFEARDGRIFEFVNGVCVNDKPEYHFLRQYRSFEEIRRQNSSTTWHEVKEPSDV